MNIKTIVIYGIPITLIVVLFFLNWKATLFIMGMFVAFYTLVKGMAWAMTTKEERQEEA